MKLRNIWLLLWLSACAPTTRLIVERSDRAAMADKDQATLVIGHVMNSKVINLLNQNGALVGQVGARQHTVLHVPPGQLRLYAFPDKQAAWGDRIEGTVEAGRVYYFAVGIRWGGLAMTVLSERLDAEEWARRKSYETELGNVSLINSQIGIVSAQLGDTRALLREVDSAVVQFDAEQKRRRQVVPADGEAGAVQPVAAVLAAAPPASPPEPAALKKGDVLRLKLKGGSTWLGELVSETGQGLLIATGAGTKLVPFAEIASREVLQVTP